jgi:hypothetical protein
MKCPPTHEYAIFGAAESKEWKDDRHHLWGFMPGLIMVGTQGERLAKFPAPQNAADPWHGYPVSALDHKREFDHRPCGALIDKWRDDGLITAVEAARIRRGKI